MESYSFLLVLAIILLSTKVLGLLSQRVHMPQVVGALLAGVILGPSVCGLITETDFLLQTSEIGVILLLFTAGLDTDLAELKKSGKGCLLIALLGVIISITLGFFAFQFFFPDDHDPMHMLKAIFMGVIIGSTSVSISIEALREMGKLRSKVGTTILGAAVIDDVIGLITLTIVSGFADPREQPIFVVVRVILFFVFIGVVGYVANHLFKRMDKDWAGKRRIAISGLVFCFILSYIAETVFGIADITGAYFAGLILCNIMRTREYIAKKMYILSYMFFSPIFFASIGVKCQISGMTGKMLLFSITLVLIAFGSKIVGCGLGAKLNHFTNQEALSVGVGMISRGEVSLIVAQKGEQVGLVSQDLFPAIVIVVIATLLLTPILLKVVMKNLPSSPECTDHLSHANHF